MSDMMCKWLLMPLAWMYESVLLLRNALYDWGIMRSRDVSHLPVICVGNLTVGGTGKTPHTEYLVKLLSNRWRTAVVSRGYRRKTHGLVYATPDMSADDIGDEPWQMYHKFPNLEMVVSSDRYEGIERLLHGTEKNRAGAIVLDDAYQHRKVKAGLNILLTDYNRLMCDDVMLPAGRLREPFSGRKRAQVVIVTKCGECVPDNERQSIRKRLRLSDDQKLFFTRQKYQEIRKVFDDGAPIGPTISKTALRMADVSSVLLLAGIATPQRLLQDLRDCGIESKLLQFPDHHRFTASDVQRINEEFASVKTECDIILTTEKDEARLVQCEGLSAEVKKALYVLPLEIEFLEGKQMFDDYICDYVGKNQGNV